MDARSLRWRRHCSRSRSTKPSKGCTGARLRSVTGVRRMAVSATRISIAKVLEFGKGFKVEGGNGDRGGVLFDGRIMALEGRFLRQPPEVLVLAEDRLQDLRMTDERESSKTYRTRTSSAA